MSLVSGFVQAAEQVCYRWYSNNAENGIVGQYFPTVNAAAAAVVAYKNAHPAVKTTGGSHTWYTTVYTFESCSSSPPTGSSGSRTCTFESHRVPTGAGGVCGATVTCTSFTGQTFSISYQVDPDGCPDPPFNPCEQLAGLPAFLGYTGEGAVPGTFCATDDGGGGPGNSCQVKKAGAAISTGTGWYGQVEMTGEMCGDDPVGDENPANCVSGSGGSVCIDKKMKYCGTVNGESICLDAVSEGGCTLMADGSAVCSADALAVPKDSEGEPLQPDRVIQVNDGIGGATNFNFYSASTVNNSSSTVVGSLNGESASGGAGGGGAGGGGVGDCTEGDCYGDLPEEFGACREDVIACVQGGVAQAWDSLVDGVPLLAFVSGLHASFAGGGTCPAATATLLEQEVNLTGTMCDLLEQNAGLLGLIMRIMWSLAALRILLKSEV